MKNDTKFGEDLTCCFKIDMSDLTKVSNSKVSRICTLTGSYRPNYIMVELKRYIEVILDITKE